MRFGAVGIAQGHSVRVLDHGNPHLHSHISPRYHTPPLHQLKNKLVSEMKLFFFPAFYLYLLLSSLAAAIAVETILALSSANLNLTCCCIFICASRYSY